MASVLRSTAFASVLVLLAAPVAAQTTGLFLDSQPGDYVGGGVVRMYGAFDAAFGPIPTYNNGVSITVRKTSPYEDWSLNFSAHNSRLQVGTYAPAMRYPFADLIGLDISGMARGCNELVGRFEILEIVYDANGNLQRFAADFEQHCENAAAGLFGAIRYNSTVSTLVPFGGAYPSYRLIIEQPENGVVTADGIQCGAGAIDCDLELSGPADVSLTAWPDDGYLFAGWTGACHGARTISMKLNMPKRCAARFEPISAPAPRTLLFWNSRRGDWIGAGRREVYAAANSAFAATSSEGGNGVLVEVTSLRDSRETKYRLDFRAPLGSLLLPGTYPGATRAPFRTTTPGLDVSGDGRGCNRVLGAFTVHEIQISAGGAIERLAVDFEHRCEPSVSPPLFGSLRLNSAVDLVPALGLDVNGWGQVSITPPSRSCGDDCAVEYAAGTSVSLAAAPSPGWAFAGLSGDADCLDGQITMSAPVLCVATFVETPRRLTIEMPSNGRVTSTPSGIYCGLGGTNCSASFPSLANLTLVTTPASGWTFAGWQGDPACGTSILLNADLSCRAVFRPVGVCASAITPNTIDADASGANYPLSVTTYPGCSWSAASNVPWITPLTTGTRPGGTTETVNIRVAGKASPGERSATIVLAGVTITVRQPGAALLRRARWDFDADGRADITVWRPGNGVWFTRYSSSSYGTFSAQQWGWGAWGDQPVPGDYDGDGQMDIAVWRPGPGMWFILTSSSGYTTQFERQWGSGALGDRPVPGDYDGDGATDIAVWRPDRGNWFILKSSENLAITHVIQWGSAPHGDRPMPADYDGDGSTDLAVWRADSGTWHVKTSSSGFASSFAVQWGSRAHGDIPLARDFDGDGRAEFTVWRPGPGYWFILHSTSNYTQSSGYQWGSGALGDQPLAEDYDGDGRADLLVWRPGPGVWCIRLSGTNYVSKIEQQWGAGSLGDQPQPPR